MMVDEACGFDPSAPPQPRAPVKADDPETQLVCDACTAVAAWAEAVGANEPADNVAEKKRREYHRATTRWAWMAWQAARAAERERCQPNGLMFDALGEPRTRYVRVTLDGSHMILRPQDGDRYVQEARDSGDESGYVVADVYLSEREFDDLPEFDGF